MTDNKPTYEEVVAYAKSQGLIGKVDTSRFYDYYDKQNFMFRGAVMDWKSKLWEWANSQRSRVTPTGRETEAIRQMGEPIKVDLLDEIKRRFALA